MSLYGIYGEHTVEQCPSNNPETAKQVIKVAESDPRELMKKHGTYYVPTIMAGDWVAQKAKIDGFFPQIIKISGHYT